MKSLAVRIAGGLAVAIFGVVVLTVMGAPEWAVFGLSWIAYLIVVESIR